MNYPEHEKLRLIAEKSQAIGQFLDAMQSKGISLCQFNDRYQEYLPYRKSMQEMLAEHFEIDLKVLGAEKDAMLEELRKANERSGAVASE